MTPMNDTNSGLLLDGLDGANPLAFLAALGTVIVLHSKFPDLRVGWKMKDGSWKPFIGGCGDDKDEFSENLLAILESNSMATFDIDKKMPFETSKFIRSLQSAQICASMEDRRNADFLAAFGTELYPSGKNGEFQDSSFRMVRSGDSAGQGLPYYAKDIQEKTKLEHIQRALFQTWDYQDKFDDQGRHYFSLRWDPIEDQRYALRWQDPSNKSGPITGPGTMLAANSLAIEALRYFPVVLVGNQAHTTGFHKFGKRKTYFIWPVWTPMVNVDTTRSLVALDDLSKEPIPHQSLAQRGITEIYRSQRIRPNQYYSNFTTATSA